MALDVRIDKSVPGSIGDTFLPTRNDEREEAKGTGSNSRQYEEGCVLTPSHIPIESIVK